MSGDRSISTKCRAPVRNARVPTGIDRERTARNNGCSVEVRIIQDCLVVEREEYLRKEQLAIEEYQRRGYKVLDLHQIGVEDISASVREANGGAFHHHGRYGAPDLFVWKDGEWFFVEVKCYPDSLRLQQILWFAMNNLPLRLLWIVERKHDKLTMADLQLREMIERCEQ